MHPKPEKPQYAPHCWSKPAYGRKIWYAPDIDHSSKLDAKGKQKVQSIVGSLLYYGRTIDSSIRSLLNEISTEQASPTENTIKKCHMLVDYMHTNPYGHMCYVTGKIQLMIVSDAAYLVLPNAQSQEAGHFMLEARPNKYSEHNPPLNAPILIQCKTIKNVVCSPSEAEFGGIFDNGQMTVTIRRILTSSEHPQVSTPIKTRQRHSEFIRSFFDANQTQ